MNRRDGDRVARVHPHRVEIFDRADDDAVVFMVAHHFHLELFPPEQRLLDKNFGDRRELQTTLGYFFELVPIVADAAPGAAQGKCGSNNEWEAANPFRDFAGFCQIMGRATDGHIEADGDHEVFEHLAVFAALDGFGVGADHFDAVLFQDTPAMQGHGGIEGSLATQGRQQHQLVRSSRGFSSSRWRVHSQAFHLLHLARNDLLDTFRRYRLDVGAVGKLRIRHDRGRVGIHQDDAVALLFESFAGLGARVIELTGLADDDRTSADDQDRMNIRALGHTSKRTDETRPGARLKGKTLQWISASTSTRQRPRLPPTRFEPGGMRETPWALEASDAGDEWAFALGEGFDTVFGPTESLVSVGCSRVVTDVEMDSAATGFIHQGSAAGEATEASNLGEDCAGVAEALFPLAGLAADEPALMGRAFTPACIHEGTIPCLAERSSAKPPPPAKTRGQFPRSKSPTLAWTKVLPVAASIRR
ncbi:hypothetical protein SBV1_2740025 [Verrucomicrobia bacterium]|nr:hypothetical protein SBV1_2740025 [Verrucomicrobiota bacterium]